MRSRMVTVFVALAAVTVLEMSEASAQVTDPENWGGDWTGTVTSKVDESCGEGGEYTVSKTKVRFTLKPNSDRTWSVGAVGQPLPSLLPEGNYASVSTAEGLLVRDDPPVTVTLKRTGLKLHYSAVRDTKCGGGEYGVLQRRTSSGIVACDNTLGIRLAVLACPAIPSDRAGGYFDVDTLKKFKKLKGKAKKRQEQSCRQWIDDAKVVLYNAGCLNLEIDLD